MTASPLAQTTNDMFNAPIAEADPEIAEILDAELSRQQDGLEMIASENFVPRAVLQAQGSVLTNKYAEGYPGRRYYGGCEQVDKIETIARDYAPFNEYILSRPSPGSVQKACSAPNTPTCSPIRARRPMHPYTRRSSSQATPCSDWPSTMAAISPTA